MMLQSFFQLSSIYKCISKRRKYKYHNEITSQGPHGAKDIDHGTFNAKDYCYKALHIFKTRIQKNIYILQYVITPHGPWRERHRSRDVQYKIFETGHYREK